MSHYTDKLMGCSTSPPGWGSEAHTYAVFSLARRNTRCRQRTFRTVSCSRSLLGRSGSVLNIHDIMLARNVHGYTATRKWRVLKVTAPVAAPGAESAVYDCMRCWHGYEDGRFPRTEPCSMQCRVTSSQPPARLNNTTITFPPCLSCMLPCPAARAAFRTVTKELSRVSGARVAVSRT